MAGESLLGQGGYEEVEGGKLCACAKRDFAAESQFGTIGYDDVIMTYRWRSMKSFHV